MRASFVALLCAAASAAGGQQPFSYNASAPLNARVVQHADTVGFVREKVIFDGGRGSRVPAIVAVPKAGPARKPLILLIDGIGGWKERWWQRDSWNRGRLLIDSLLAAGFAVAMADAPASGERTFENDFVSAESFIGDTLKWREMGVKNAIESRRFLDYLTSRPDIDPTRIGLLGLSHGGMLTFALAVNDPRVKAAVTGLAPPRSIPTVLNPFTYAASVRVPLLMFAANGDAWYSRALVDSAYELVPAKAKQLLWLGSGHRPMPEYVRNAAQWFRAALKPAAVTAALSGGGTPTADRLFRIVDTVVIDTRKAELVSEPLMAMRADGSLAVFGRGRRLVYFDSTGKQRWVRSLEDIYVVSAIGWNGDSIYLADNYTDQTLLVGSNGGVGRIIDSPDMVRPLWKDRGTSTAYGELDVAVRLENGSLIGTPRRPHRFGFYGPKKPADPNVVPVLRVNPDGIIEHQIASVLNTVRGDKWFALSDGRIVLLRPGSDSLRLTALSPTGDTLFKRGLPPAKTITGVVGGSDGTIWVSTGALSPDGLHTALDAKGNILGALTLDGHLRVGAGDANHVWVWDNRGASKPIFRYTVRP